MKRRGFTLIELLVVIAIIAILAAILFPVFARARENARRASCASNQKQIGLGLMQYAQDYDERMPLWPKDRNNNNVVEGYYFMEPSRPTFTRNPLYAMSPYLKNTQVFACPSATPRSDWAAPTALSDLSYQLSGTALEIHMARIPAPAELVFMQEHVSRWMKIEMRPRYKPYGGVMFEDWTYVDAAGKPLYSNIHFDGGNLLYCDGHVKWTKNSNLRASMFGLGGQTAACTNGAVNGSPNNNSITGAKKVYCIQF